MMAPHRAVLTKAQNQPIAPCRVLSHVSLVAAARAGRRHVCALGGSAHTIASHHIFFSFVVRLLPPSIRRPTGGTAAEAGRSGLPPGRLCCLDVSAVCLRSRNGCQWARRDCCGRATRKRPWRPPSRRWRPPPPSTPNKARDATFRETQRPVARRGGREWRPTWGACRSASGPFCLGSRRRPADNKTAPN